MVTRTEFIKDLLAQLPEITAEEYEAQIISFAYGNTKMENPQITRDMVEQAYRRLHAHLKPSRNSLLGR